MTEVTRTRTIAADATAIWDVLSDFGSIGSWADNVDHSCILEPAAADGGAIGLARRVQAGRNTLVERIAEFVEPTTLAYDIDGLPPRLTTVRNRWVLAPEGPERTHVFLTTTIEAGPRPPQQLAAGVVARVFARQSDVMLAGLAHHLEDPRV